MSPPQRPHSSCSAPKCRLGSTRSWSTLTISTRFQTPPTSAVPPRSESRATIPGSAKHRLISPLRLPITEETVVEHVNKNPGIGGIGVESRADPSSLRVLAAHPADANPVYALITTGVWESRQWSSSRRRRWSPSATARKLQPGRTVHRTCKYRYSARRSLPRVMVGNNSQRRVHPE